MRETLVSPKKAGVILVTGATGFVGRHVCATLVAEGYDVRALVRHQGRAHLPPEVVQVPARDLNDLERLNQAVSGCTGIVHLAARVHVLRETATNPLEAFRQVNVLGTLNVLRAAMSAGVGQLVFVSSIAAADPEPTPYGRSKLEAEVVIAETVAGTGVTAVILRPPGVYGPGMPGNIPRLVAQIRRGFPIPIPRDGNQRSLIFVGNLAAAISASLLYNRPGVHTFAVADRTPLSTETLAESLGSAIGRRPRFLRLPTGLMRRVGRLGDRIARVLPIPITSRLIDRLFGSLVLDVSDAQAQLGFVPPIPTETALAITARSYRVHLSDSQ